MHILMSHKSDLIIKSKFFEVFLPFDLSKKCMDVSCWIKLVSDMSKI